MLFYPEFYISLDSAEKGNYQSERSKENFLKYKQLYHIYVDEISLRVYNN